MGAAAFPLVDTRDVGAAVAAVLRDPAAHAGATYALTGPSARDLRGDRRGALRPDRCTRSATSRSTRRPSAPGLLDAGIPEWRADDLAAIASAYRAADNVVTDDLSALLGRPATPFTRFLDDHRETYLAGASRSHL